MSEPRIERIELTPLHVPFRAAVREAMAGSEGGLGMALAAEEAWLGGDFAICRLIADDGSVGLGEAFVWLPETGVSPSQLIDTVRDVLAGLHPRREPLRCVARSATAWIATWPEVRHREGPCSTWPATT